MSGIWSFLPRPVGLVAAGAAIFFAALMLPAVAQTKDQPLTFETAAAGVGAGINIERNVAYGSAPEQVMDIYLPGKTAKAPIIVMVHGGAWAFGSKSARGVVENKVSHWLPKGYILVAVETRLLPQADPLEQASDVAAAVVSVEHKAAGWGGDASKIVLMGHSAGAHLVALVSADHSHAQKAGLTPWLGTIALDSAAYDVTAIMQQPRHPRFYDRVFGNDPSFWAAVSPTRQIRQPVPPMLLVCSSLRSDSCPQAQAFAAKAGQKAEVMPVPLRHDQINTELGVDNGYTRDVDGFLKTLGLP